MVNRRLAAIGALLLALISLALAVIAAVSHFPRGLIVLVLVVVALAVAWYSLLHRGYLRAIGLGLSVLAFAAALVLLLARDPLIMIFMILCALAALAAARTAFAIRAELPAVDPPKHPVLIFNPRSGGGKAERFHLAEEARQRGIEAIELSPGHDLVALAEDALARGADALAMAGGDGSQAVVAAAAARAGVPYACIPAGTRNHFALDLGVDRDDVVGALDAFVEGGERVVDLADVNGRVFVNNVSLGLYADAVQHAGYRDAKLRTLLDTIPDVAGPSASAPGLRWRDPDGFSHEGGLALLISNNPYRLGHMVGSGTRPRLDTAHLGVAVMAPTRELGGGVLQLWSLSEVNLEADAELAAGLDGEAVTLTPPLRFIMRPAALRVRISTKHPGASPAAALPENAWVAVGELAKLALTGAA